MKFSIPKFRETLRQHIGFIPVLEWRNQVLMGPSIPRIFWSESREVKRLKNTLSARKVSGRVACIIPTYQRHERLLTAIESVLAQTFQDIIIVVVDDGGGLPPLPSDPRLVAVSLSKNSGIAGVVRNVGIRLSESEFIAFLDDDNTWHPEHLALCLESLEAGNDLVYTALARLTPSGRKVDVVSAPFDRRTFINAAYVDTSAIVVRRKPHVLFSRLPRDRNTLPGEDWEFVYRLSRSARVTHIPIVTVDYLVNPDSFYTPWATAATQ